MAKLYIPNTGNKLLADVFVHIAKPPVKTREVVVSTELDITSDQGIEFKAKVVDYWTGDPRELGTVLTMMSDGITSEEAREAYRGVEKVGLYIIKKV